MTSSKTIIVKDLVLKMLKNEVVLKARFENQPIVNEELVGITSMNIKEIVQTCIYLEYFTDIEIANKISYYEKNWKEIMQENKSNYLTSLF